MSLQLAWRYVDQGNQDLNRRFSQKYAPRLRRLWRFMGLIMESQPFQDSRRMLVHTRGARRRLFGRDEMQQITFLSSGGECTEGFGQFGVISQTLLKLLGHIELCRAFHLHLGA